jgi:hypothetical protein
MANGMPTRIMTLFLALWVVIAPAVLAAPAAATTAHMSATADPASGDCDCCPNSTIDKHLCPFACLNSMAFAITPKPGGAAVIRSIPDKWRDSNLALDGRSDRPEPPPPKSSSPR